MYHSLQMAYAVMKRRSLAVRLRLRGVGVGRILTGQCGFFGNMFMTLNGVRACEFAGVQPEPWWDRTCLYFDDSRGLNAWDNYFQPMPAIDRQPGATRGRRVLAFRPTADAITPRYAGLSVRQSYARCIARYIHLRDDVRQMVDRDWAAVSQGGRVVGVHVRMTDASAGREGRQGFSFDQYFQRVDREVAHLPDSRVLLASDAVEAVDAFVERYGDRVATLDCIRSADGTSIHGHYDAGVTGSPYQKGLEVVRDAYLLARCDVLIGGYSRVTAYALCLSPDLAFVNVGEVALFPE